MLKSTKPFKDFVTNYPKEPSLRIGRKVPKNAVNLAYYYNPTATDAEKVLTAEAPRKTIDHRIEDAYRYLFNQASDDDELFPKSVSYEDEDGYKGRLGRMYVQWYPEAHIETKNVQETKDIIVIDKSEVPKMFEYADDAGYTGNLYLDATSYEVTKTKDVSVTEHLDREVNTHELNYQEIFKSYIAPNNLDTWMVDPTKTGSLWPASITLDEVSCSTTSGNSSIQEYVNNTANPYDEAVGVLVFDSLEYEQVFKGAAASGVTDYALISSKFVSDTYEYTVAVADALADAQSSMKAKYEATYSTSTDKYSYTKIEEFIEMAEARCSNSSASFFNKIKQAMLNNKDIVVYMDRIDMVLTDSSSETSSYVFKAKYKYKISDRGTEGTYQYNVVANYKGVLVKTIVTPKEVPAEYKATCNYVGIVRKVWYDYDGIAYYRGSVTKGNSIGNVNPENDNEILMFSDDNGYLRRPVIVTDENGNTSIDNFYEVEADYIYLTDVFKDGKACFYKYPLKRDIYDYRGPDENGFYEGNAVKICTANFRDTPTGYVHNMKLRVSETEIVDDITDDFQITSKEVPKRYAAELYTSFISSSTDTFKVTYNAFNDSDEDNIAIDNGTTEDIYNYPFMNNGVDFFMEPLERNNLTRINRVKLPAPKVIEDTRNYVSFSYTITAERKEDGKKFTTSERTASILNRDFIVPAEYEKFDGRGMIISPESDGVLLSPLDLVLHDQAASRIEPIISAKDTGFVFYTTITKINNIYRGAVNIKCNPDGSGYITAETTIDTGFFDEKTGAYTKKLCLDNPYWMEDGKIYPGFKIKCIDSRHIKVNAPRHDGLLESWYPMIQFGHYSQVMDQYGAHTKVFYSMPEYDDQYYSPKYKKPYVDVESEKVTILNSHMVKTKCYPLFIKKQIPDTIKLYKVLDDERFEIKIRDVSFSDGIIVTESTVSENDNIICDYTYVEENYIYRGYWRNINDFARIDLNPNMYHTYSDMNYIPSVTKPSKNLFNKVIYFFMRPSLIIEGTEVVDTEVVIDSTDENLLAKMYNESDLLEFKNADFKIHTGDEKEARWTNVNGTIQGITNDSCLYMFKTLNTYKFYEHTVTMLSTNSDNDCLVVVLSVVKNSTGFDTLSLVCRMNAAETHCSLPENTQFALVHNYYQPNQKIIATDDTFNSTGAWNKNPSGMTVKIIKDIDGTIKIFRTNMNWGTGGAFDTNKKSPVIQSTLQDIRSKTGTDYTDGAIGYGNVSQSGATFKGIKFGIYSENRTTHIEYDFDNPALKNEDTLYHQIDNSQPEEDHDIYIGSVYIRQNTSLHSTVLVDARVRGGGVIKEMSDTLRRELEPESDFYLDIGYYDGEPYQENGVIIVRLDNSLLKEFGGRFTHDDIEAKVKRWLGFGIYPIIEYVDSYSKKDMPQYNLTVEDSYINVIDETPQIYLECVDI